VRAEGEFDAAAVAAEAAELGLPANPPAASAGVLSFRFIGIDREATLWVNLGDEPVTETTPFAAEDLVTGESVEGRFAIPAHRYRLLGTLPETGAAPETPAAPTRLALRTLQGAITVELFDDRAPITAGNFLLLAEEGFYDGLSFHRVEPRFVIQGGDPLGNGTGGPGFTIPLEVAPGLTHDRGTLSMARRTERDTAGCQFFICLTREKCACLDGDYAAFGRVIEGMDVVNRIRCGDYIIRVQVESESPRAAAAREAARAARVPE